MPQHRQPDESLLLTSQSPREMSLPPGLQINPVKEAFAPVSRKMSLLVSFAVSLVFFWGGFHIIELSQRNYLQPLKGEGQAVRLLLMDDCQISAMHADGGGISSKHPDNQPEIATNLPAPMANLVRLRTDESQSVPESLAPSETPKDLPIIPAGVQIPLLAGGSAGSGIGSGAGSGIGNGFGKGDGQGRGGTWIHSASGGEGIRVTDCFVGVQDYIHPEYPRAARIAGVSGDVVIEVTIDETGKPIKWKVIEGHPGLAAAALEVFPRWRFLPVKYNGQRVSATFDVRIRFTLF